MAFVIAEPCVDVMDRSCMEECPVDCIYEGARKLYIHPVECIDCGACEPVCPVEAISPAYDLDDDQAAFATAEEEFFTTVLKGRGEALGDPGGAASVGSVGADVDLIASYPARENGSA